jgi:hypothetical protein
MESMRDLECRYDSRASFYGKAVVVVEGGDLKLLSYGTHVATIEYGKAEVIATHSATTLRHIKEFLLQNGFEAENKKQIQRDYMGV